MLNQHNKYRELHQAKPLEFDEDLNDQAASCATSLATGENHCFMQDDWGLNTWTSPKSDVKILLNSDLPEDDPVKTWYEEGKDYPGFYQPVFPKPVDNFTQLVWKSSKILGCGFYGVKFVVVTCHYTPKGNVRKKNLNVTIKNYELNVIPLPPVVDESTNISYWWLLLGVITLVLVFLILLLFKSDSSAEDIPDSSPEDGSDFSPEDIPDYPQEDVSDSPPEYE